MIFRHLLNMRSHPTWVRGLKRNHDAEIQELQKSHPTWVRGLKHVVTILLLLLHRVAPYVGAWIETLQPVNCRVVCESHPTWVRGLKHNDRGS